MLVKDVLSRTKNGKIDPSSHQKSYNLLSRALSIAYLGDSSKKLLPLGDAAVIRYAETLRTVSAAFHNAAALFLNNKQETASTEFWRRSAELGQEAIKLWDSLPPQSDDDESDAKTWTALREVHIPSRWEFLGHTLSRSGKRRVSLPTFVMNSR